VPKWIEQKRGGNHEENHETQGGNPGTDFEDDIPF